MKYKFKYGSHTVDAISMDHVTYMKDIQGRTEYKGRKLNGYLVTRDDDGRIFWSPTRNFKALYGEE